MASQLYTYLEGAIKEKFGSEVIIYKTPQAPLANSKFGKAAKSVASSKEQNSPSTTVSSKKGKAAVIVETNEDVSRTMHFHFICNKNSVLI